MIPEQKEKWTEQGLQSSRGRSSQDSAARRASTDMARIRVLSAEHQVVVGRFNALL